MSLSRGLAFARPKSIGQALLGLNVRGNTLGNDNVASFSKFQFQEIKIASLAFDESQIKNLYISYARIHRLT